MYTSMYDMTPDTVECLRTINTVGIRVPTIYNTIQLYQQHTMQYNCTNNIQCNAILPTIYNAIVPTIYNTIVPYW